MKKQLFTLITLLLLTGLGYAQQNVNVFPVLIPGMNPTSMQLDYDGTYFYGAVKSCPGEEVFRVSADGQIYERLAYLTPSTNFAMLENSVLKDSIFIYGFATGSPSGMSGATLYRVNMNTGTFTVLAQKPYVMFGPAGFFGKPIKIGNKIYGAYEKGGNDASVEVWSFDLTTNTYNAIYNFTNASHDYSTYTNPLIVNGRIYILGFTHLASVALDGTSPQVLAIPSGQEARRTPLATDGTHIYAVLQYTQANNEGIIIKAPLDLSSYVTLHSFTKATDGGKPSGGLLVDGTVLYGITYYGGTNNGGTLYKLNTDGTGFTVIKHFSNKSTEPRFCSTTPIAVGNYLYAGANEGGTGSFGSIFKIEKNGNNLTHLLNFKNAPQGAGITSYSYAYDNTYLYGYTQYGGTHGVGTIYRMLPNGTGIQTLHSFDYTDGRNPVSNPLLVGDTIYGVTGLGGNNNNGTIFKMHKNGTGFQVLHHVADDGGTFNYGGMQATVAYNVYNKGEYIYGAIRKPYPESISNGKIFRIKKDGTGFQALYHEVGPVTLSDTKLFVVDGYGYLYSMNLDGSNPTIIHSFWGATANPKSMVFRNNVIYGVYDASGLSGIFKINPNGTGFATVGSFSSPHIGSGPVGELVVKNNYLYGTLSNNTNYSGATIFKYDFDNTVTQAYNIPFVNAGMPKSAPTFFNKKVILNLFGGCGASVLNYQSDGEPVVWTGNELPATWDNPNNWNPQGEPVDDDIVICGGGGNGGPIIDNPTDTIAEITIQDSSDIHCDPNGLGALKISKKMVYNAVDADLSLCKVEFTGCNKQWITGKARPYIRHLRVYNPCDTLKIINDIYVGEVLEIFDGEVDIYDTANLVVAWNVTMDIDENSTFNGNGSLETNGTITTGTTNGGNLGFEITSTCNLGTTKLLRKHKPLTVAQHGIKSVRRIYRVLPSERVCNNVDIKIHYRDIEKNGINENELNIFVSNNGNDWYCIGGTVDTANNTVTVTGQNFVEEYYTLAAGTDVFKKWSAANDSLWHNPYNWLPRGLPRDILNVVINDVSILPHHRPVINNTLAAEVNDISINTGGDLACKNNSKLKIKRHFIKNGNADFNACQVEFYGNIDQQVTGVTTFDDLIINKPSGNLILNDNQNINSLLDIQSGNLNLNNKNLYSHMEADANEDGGRVLGLGSWSTSGTINNVTSKNPGGLGFEITTAANLGNTTITRRHDVKQLNDSNSIARNFEVVPTNNSNINAEIKVHYLEAELNGINENELSIWESENGTSWTDIGGTVNAANNYVSKAGISSLKRFYTLGISSVSIAKLSTDKFYIYPNPTNGMVYIRALKNLVNAQVQITDLTGKTVLATQLESENMPIDLQQLETGMYFVIIKKDNYIHTTKIIKK